MRSFSAYGREAENKRFCFPIYGFNAGYPEATSLFQITLGVINLRYEANQKLKLYIRLL